MADLTQLKKGNPRKCECDTHGLVVSQADPRLVFTSAKICSVQLTICILEFVATDTCSVIKNCYSHECRLKPRYSEIFKSELVSVHCETLLAESTSSSP